MVLKSDDLHQNNLLDGSFFWLNAANLKSQELNLDNYQKLPRKSHSFYIYLHPYFEHFVMIRNLKESPLQEDLTNRKKVVLGRKKAANKLFDANDHSQPHKIKI